MRSTRQWTIAGGCLIALVSIAWAQTRKAGLWEVTTVMTWQQSPMPPGMGGMPPGANAPHTVQVCLTQQQIDKYGAIPPQTRGGCHMANVVTGAHGMTADMVCTGAASGKGTIESSWKDDQHASGKVHFIGSIQAGPNARPIEWTAESTSVYKSADCGQVKPLPMPEP